MNLSLLLDLLFAMLATNQSVEIWHHGSIFSRCRDLAGAGVEHVPRWLWPLRVPLELLLCPFCLSVWVAAFWTFIVLNYPPGSWPYWPLYALGITKLAQLLNDWHHPWTRSPAGTRSETVDLTQDVDEFRILDEISQEVSEQE